MICLFVTIYLNIVDANVQSVLRSIACFSEVLGTSHGFGSQVFVNTIDI